MDRETLISFINKLDKTNCSEEEKLEILKELERTLNELPNYRQYLVKEIFLKIDNQKERDLFLEAIKEFKDEQIGVLEAVINSRIKHDQNAYTHVKFMIDTISSMEGREFYRHELIDLFRNQLIYTESIDNIKKIINFLEQNVNTYKPSCKIKKLLSAYKGPKKLIEVIDKIEEFKSAIETKKAMKYQEYKELEKSNSDDENYKSINGTPINVYKDINLFFERSQDKYLNLSTLAFSIKKVKSIMSDETKLDLIIKACSSKYVVETGKVDEVIEKIKNSNVEKAKDLVKIITSEAYEDSLELQTLAINEVYNVEEQRHKSMMSIVTDPSLLDNVHLLSLAIEAIKKVELPKLNKMEETLTSTLLIEASFINPQKYQLAISTINQLNINRLKGIEIFKDDRILDLTIEEIKQEIEVTLTNAIPKEIDVENMTQEDLAKYQLILRKNKKD